jgi:uncharacterized delta-60 repeat protein
MSSTASRAIVRAAFEALEGRRLLSTSGALDRSFGSGGVALARVSSPYPAAATLVDSAGRVLVVGNAWADSTETVAITRFTTGGTPDVSFGTGGTVVQTFSANGPDQVYATAIQPDGKILLAGSFGSAFGLARFNTNGSLDASFGSAGVVTTSISGDTSTWGDDICGLVVQADGKILVAGDADTSIALARYNTDGSLDSTFGRRGIAITAAPEGSDFVEDYGLAVLPNGDILVVGDGGTMDGSTAHDVFAYYRGNGTLLALDRGPNDAGSFGPVGFAVQPDGSIVTAEATGGDAAARETGGVLERHFADGSLDTSFGAGGRVTLPMSSVSALAAQPDGKLLVLGGGEYGSLLARYDAGGAADATFGVEGRMIVSKADLAGSIAIGPDGSIFASGIKSGTAFSVTKFSPHVGVSTPTAALSARDLTTPGQNQVPMTVTYSSDIDPSTLGDDDLNVGDELFPQATFSGYARNADGSIAASYVLELGYGQDFTPDDNGAYAISVNEGAVLTATGAAVPGQTLGTVTIAIPPAPAGLRPPTATMTASDIAVPATISEPFTVTYQSDAGIDPAMINGPVYVTGPDGQFAMIGAAFVRSTQNADGSVTATYSLAKYNLQQFLPSDNGAYTIGVGGERVTDIYGNAVPQDALGTIHVNVPPPPAGAVAPTATLDKVDTSQADTTLLTVTYRGTSPIAPATIDGSDLSVQDGHGNFWRVTVQSTQSNADGSLTATYAFTPSDLVALGSMVVGGTSFTQDQAGGSTSSMQTCTASVNGVQVSDVQGSTVAAGAIGTFQALVPDSPPSGVTSLGGNSYIAPIARTVPGMRLSATSHHHHHHHRYGHAYARHRRASVASRRTTTKHGAWTAAGHRR